MLGTLEDRYLSRDCHRLARKHDVEIEWGAMHLPAGQAVAHADTIRLAPRLEPDLATSAAALMDGVAHLR